MLIEADLPEDAAALRALVLEQDRTSAALTAERVAADAEMARPKAMLDAFMRHRFGARSEKLDLDQLPLGLEDVETAVASAEAATDAKSGGAATDRPRKRNRGAQPAHLKRIEQVVDVESRDCPCCGGALHQSARTSPSGSMSSRRPSACWSPAAPATAAVHARAR